MGVPGLLNTCPLDSAHLRHLYRPGAWGVHAPPLAPQLGLATLWPTPHPYCLLKLPAWLRGRPVGAQVVGRPALWPEGRLRPEPRRRPGRTVGEGSGRPRGGVGAGGRRRAL